MNRSFEQLKNDLGRRVGPLLPDVPTGEFEQLIDQMAILQYRYDVQRSSDQSAASRQSDAGDCDRNVMATAPSVSALPGN